MKDKPKKLRIFINNLKGVPVVTADDIIEELGEGALEELSDEKGEDNGIQ